ncbi:MAG: sulfur carrier protein ThiS [Desulfobacterales bacterium]|jgi:sulfur carrier protein|nr:sulfur carrier protein ThiS [Desulfobacterales bacterium]
MRVTVNGSPEDITPCSLLAFIQLKGLSGKGLVVEHNYRIIKKDDWDTVWLEENDNLEVLSFVGGG